MKITSSTFLYTAAILIGVGLLAYAVFVPKEEGTDPDINPDINPVVDVQALAQCLTDGGTKFYYARWCGHCETQIEMFGDSFELLDSTDCAVSDSSKDGFIQECTDLGIEAVPTWIFPDGTMLTGVRPFDHLVDLGDCMDAQLKAFGPEIEDVTE